MSTLQQILRFLIETFGDLFLIVVILRFWLQQARADFYNPLSQAIVKITNPALLPLRKLIPGFFGIDLAAILLAILVNIAVLTLIVLVSGHGVPPLAIILYGIVDLLLLVCNIALVAILILAISSFIAPFSTHPVLVLVRQMLDPLLRPIQKIVPPAGGLDFSVMFLALGIYVVRIVLQNMLAY